MDLIIPTLVDLISSAIAKPSGHRITLKLRQKFVIWVVEVRQTVTPYTNLVFICIR